MLLSRAEFAGTEQESLAIFIGKTSLGNRQKLPDRYIFSAKTGCYSPYHAWLMC
jgi:hypothetical protein